jgi:hypothetical protein
METTIKTQSQAVNEFRNALIEFELNGTIETELKTSVTHSLRDIQLRDFAMGITAENHTPELVLAFLDYLGDTTITEEIAPIESVRASFLYRLGHTTEAYSALDKATEANPKYALTILLRRVFGSGWPVEAFTAMTQELHPKVVAGIQESECELLIA